MKFKADSLGIRTVTIDANKVTVDAAYLDTTHSKVHGAVSHKFHTKELPKAVGDKVRAALAALTEHVTALHFDGASAGVADPGTGIGEKLGAPSGQG